MYIFLLWMRYLRTRYLAMVCVVSVMLGVTTLIVVNSVMSGFSTMLQERLASLQSDIVVESIDPLYGFPLPADELMRRVRESPAGPKIQAMAPSVELFAIMQFKYMGRNWTQRVRLVGVDAKAHAELGGWAQYLTQEHRKAHPSFDLTPEAMEQYKTFHPPLPPDPLFQPPPAPASGKPIDQIALPPVGSKKPLNRLEDLPPVDGPPREVRQPRSIIVGNALAKFRDKAGNEKTVLSCGDTAMIYTVGSESLEPVWDEFIVCDYIKSDLSEFDANTVFVPLDYLQHLRTMEGRVNTLQIRLKDRRDDAQVKEALQRLLSPDYYHVATWKDKQAVLLAAISIERGILNVLLFLIVGVAGFGILAIFSMIVREKTRDIGILKSLGASNAGVRRIFMGYGLLLGVVGSLLGTGLGLLITRYINEIEAFLSRITGAEIFPRGVYYFDKIPTNVQLSSVLAVDAGAILIAVVFSIWPAYRASRMHPVQALRYE